MCAVSVDTVAAQRAFASTCDVRFPMLADSEGRVTALYGVASGPFAQRVSFVLDGEGRVRYVDEHVRVTRHGPDILRRIRELKR